MAKKTAYRELSCREIVEKYPDVSPFVILKADLQRRTVVYTERAREAAKGGGYQLQARGIFTSIGDAGADCYPVSLMLRDGTSVFVSPVKTSRPPYVIDVIDGRKVITDGGEIVEEVDFWYKPDYMSKTTSSGRPMWKVASARPQRMDIDAYYYCHFWDEGKGCRYCNMGSHFKKGGLPAKVDPKDVFETVREALKQPGRFCYIKMTAGSVLSGRELFDDEADMYIALLQAAGRNFETRRFPSQMISSAFSLKQLSKIYENTGLMSYTCDMEVLNEEKFAWICPGKNKALGYCEWKKRILEAVGIFGRGFVNTGIVGGVELAKPNGFATEDEALDATLEEAEDFASHGVSVIHCVWVPYPGSAFSRQVTPSLEYFVRLSKGLNDLRVKYGLAADMDDYRRCGNHPDTDLARVKP
ncbi:MAG: hypothetical protein LBD04_02160 [Synergistaceae bacterium]|jgi:hypothetical protein|nr:hypothetical protein [Synergistaceae bacterium]